MAAAPNARHEKVKYGYASLARKDTGSEVTVVPNYIGKYNSTAEEPNLPSLKTSSSYSFHNMKTGLSAFDRVKRSMDPTREQKLIELGNSLISPTLAK